MLRLVLLSMLACLPAIVQAAVQRNPPGASDDQELVLERAEAGPARSKGAAPAANRASGTTSANEPPRLDTVVVTARHREEILQQTPLSISALDADELQSRGADNLAALARAVPNVTIYPARQNGNAITAYIRGVGQSEQVWGIEPGVGVYLDDVLLARPQAALLDILDVERIEVLRGPQGTLYGRNTIGGAIRYVTRAPTVDFSGSVGVTLGQYGRRDAKAVLNVPLSDRLLTRLAIAQFGRDGYGLNLQSGAGVGGRDSFAGRLTADWAVHDALDVRLAYDVYLDDSGPPGAQRLITNRFDPARTPPDPGRYDVRSGVPALDRASSRGASATVDWHPGGAWRLKSITAARRSDSEAFIDFDLLPPPISDLSRFSYEKQRSQEFQFQTEGERGHAIAGLYLFDGEAGGWARNIRMRSWTQSSGWVRTRSAGLYGDATWHPAPGWSIEAGLRYTVERKSADVLNRLYTDATFTVPNGIVAADFTDTETFRSLSPRLNVSWQPAPNTMLYAQVARGYRAGGYNIRANTRAVPESGLPFDDETVVSTELGAKGAWRDGRLTANAAIFQGKHRDIQLSVATGFDANGDGIKDAVFNDFRNAGRGTSRGADIELGFQARRIWRLLGHAGYLDTRYDEYLSDGVDIAASQRFTNAPRWTAGASVIADLDLARGGNLVARLDGAYRSQSWPSGDLVASGGLSTLTVQGGHSLWNASLGWRDPASRWQVTLAAENLGDKTYHVTGWDLPIVGIASVFNGPPRQLSVNATYYFR